MEKIASIYCSKEGTSKETAMKIQKKNPNNIDLIDISRDSKVDIKKYDAIYIGGGIYANNLPAPISQFIKINSEQLKGKKVYLYIHGLNSAKIYKDIVKRSIGEANFGLLKQVFYLGGKLDMSKQNMFVKLMIKTICKKNNLDSTYPNNINMVEINKLLSTVEKN